MKWHMCLNVRGFLSHTKFPSGYVGMFKHDDGRPMSADDARDTLYNELTQGHEVIPMGECSNFDYKTGCKGHQE